MATWIKAGEGKLEREYAGRCYRVSDQSASAGFAYFAIYVEDDRAVTGWRWIGWKRNEKAAKAFALRHMTTGYEMES